MESLSSTQMIASGETSSSPTRRRTWTEPSTSTPTIVTYSKSTSTWFPVVGKSLATEVEAALIAKEGVDVQELSALLVLLNEVAKGMTAGDLNLLVSEGSPAREQFVLFLRATVERSLGNQSLRQEQRFMAAFIKGGE